MSYDHIFKFIMVGDSGVGKSNISSRFIKNQFDIGSKTTLGVEFFTKDVIINHTNIKVQLWDTAGQERYKSIVTSYYRGAIGIILVYDISNRTSFNNLRFWLQQIETYCPNNIKILIIGNKNDLPDREISLEEGKLFANQLGALFMEVSALHNYNICEAIELLVNDIYFNTHDKLIDPITHVIINTSYLKPEGPTPLMDTTSLINVKQNTCC